MEKITIICTRDRGIYRGGVFHPPGVTHWDLSSFNQSQIESIKKEPLLVVKEGDTPVSIEDAIKDAADVLRPFIEMAEQVVTEAIAEIVAKKQDTEEDNDAVANDDKATSEPTEENSDAVAKDDEVTLEPIVPRSRKRGARHAQ